MRYLLTLDKLLVRLAGSGALSVSNAFHCMLLLVIKTIFRYPHFKQVFYVSRGHLR